MSFVFDEVWINNGQLVVGDNNINPPDALGKGAGSCLLYTSPSPRD